jgi:hypothetical protein
VALNVAVCAVFLLASVVSVALHCSLDGRRDARSQKSLRKSLFLQQIQPQPKPGADPNSFCPLSIIHCPLSIANPLQGARQNN